MRRTMTATHSAIGAAALILVAVLGTGVATAHSPVAGAVNNYPKNTALTYKFAATTYPAWVYSVANGTLTSSWPSSTANNSASPRFTLDAAGTGTVEYLDQDTSPCSGNLDWAQCSKNWGSSYFKLYIRNLATNPTIRWYDDTNSCPSGKACYYARRGFIHEVEHVALGVNGHDSQGEANTVMGDTLPANPTSGWNTTTTRRCSCLPPRRSVRHAVIASCLNTDSRLRGGLAGRQIQPGRRGGLDGRTIVACGGHRLDGRSA